METYQSPEERYDNEHIDTVAVERWMTDLAKVPTEQYRAISVRLTEMRFQPRNSRRMLGSDGKVVTRATIDAVLEQMRPLLG